MQINMSGLNAGIYTTNAMLKNRGGSNTAKQGNQSAFGAQCKVTISKEGRVLSDQSQGQGIQKTSIERMLLRQQKQTQDYQDEYAKTVEEINALRQALNSTSAAEDQDTIEKKQEALRRMEELKVRQDEENKKKLEEAEGKAAGALKEQQEIDQKNRSLYIMIKSFEEDEDGTSSRSHKKDGDSGESEESGGLGKEIEESASLLGVSAARREMQTTDVIQELDNDGLALIAEADRLMNSTYEMLDEARRAMEDDTLSEEEKRQYVSECTGMARSNALANMGDMMRMRAKGLQERQDARELAMKHIDSSPLDDISGVQRAMMDLSKSATILEEAGGVLSEDSQELEEKIQDAIDNRNDTTTDPKEDEEEKAAEELEQEKLEEERLENEKLEKEKSEQEIAAENKSEPGIVVE